MYLQIKKNGNVKYLYLCESVYDKNTKKTKTRNVESYGNYEKLQKERPEFLAELEEKYGNKNIKKQNQRLDNFDKLKELIKKSDVLYSDDSNPIILNYGHQIFKQIWDNDLKLSEHFRYLKNKSKIDYSPDDIALYLSGLKLIDPKSHFDSYKNRHGFLGEPLGEASLNDLYRCLTFLSNNKKTILEHVNLKVSQTMNGRDLSMVFYDCTNCYFETPYNDLLQRSRKIHRLLRDQLREQNIGKDLNDIELDALIDEDPECKAIIDEFIGVPLRMQGSSKEQRRDLPIVSVALVIDKNAIPIDYIIFPGNKSEKKQMVESIEALKKQYNITDTLVVADGGLNSTENLNMLVDHDYGFAVSKSVLTLKKEFEKEFLDLEQYSPILDEQGNPTGTLYLSKPYVASKYIENDDEQGEQEQASENQESSSDNSSTNSENTQESSIDNNTTPKQTKAKRKKIEVECEIIYFYNEERRLTDLRKIESNIEKAKTAVSNKTKLSPTSSLWKQYTNSNVDPKDLKADSLKIDLIEKHKRRAGFTAILWKKSPNGSKLTAKDFGQIYQKLVRIEECFRIMKSNFSIRPMYVRTEDHINAHVLICILSLIVLRLLEIKLSSQNKKLTVSQIVRGFSEANLLLLEHDSECVFIKTNKMKEIIDTSGISQGYEDNYTNILLETLNLKKLKTYNTKQDLRLSLKYHSLEVSNDQLSFIRKSQ